MQEPQKSKLLYIIHISLIVIGFGLVGSFISSIYGLWRRGDIVSEKEAYLRQLEKEQIQLKNQLSYTLTQEFIEEEARNKLNMIKPGETLVVLPQESSSASELVSTMMVLPQEAVSQKSTIVLWWNLFLGRE